MANTTDFGRGYDWMDLGVTQDSNRKGFIVLPTLIPVNNAEIDDNDVAFLEEQLSEQAIVVQARRIAEREVSPINPGRAHLETDKQRLEAERETFAFGMCVVIAESASSAAIKIAVDALLAKNYLALDVPTWTYWCEQAKIEVRRISKLTRRKLSQSTVTTLFGHIMNDLPPLVLQLERAPVVTPTGEIIDPQFVIANPGILNEIGPLVKSLAKGIEEGHKELREKLDEAVNAYASMSQKEIRDYVRGINRAAAETTPEKKKAQKHVYQVVDSTTGVVTRHVTYLIPADSYYEEHQIETQLSANYEFEEVDFSRVDAMASASA